MSVTIVLCLMSDVNDKPSCPLPSKNPLKGIGGSLARRILLISLFFIGLPLILYFIFIFHTNTERHMVRIFADLQRVEAEQGELFNKWTAYQYNSLHLIHLLYSSRMQRGEEFGKEEFERVVQALTDHATIAGLIFTKFEGGSTVIKGPVGFEIKNYLNLQKLASEKHHIELINVPNLGYAFLISVLDVNFKDGAPDSVMSMLVPVERVVELLYVMQSHYPETLSIVDNRGVIVGSSNRKLVGKTAGTSQTDEVKLKPLRNYQNAWVYKWNKLNEYALFTNMAEIDSRLLVSVSESYLWAKWEEYLQQFLILLGIIVVVGGAGAYFITSRIARPMRTLAMTMAHVGEGSLGERYKPDPMGFEINHLGRLFNQMVESMVEHMHAAENERVKQEVLAAELAIGEETQKSIMPRKVPEFGGLDIDFGFIAAKEVGGDFYDVVALDENRLWVCIADTSGKGVSACLYSLLIRSMLRSFIHVSDKLEDVITQANELFIKDCGDSGIFVTAWVALYDKRSGDLTYSSLGHNPSLIKRAAGEIDSLTTEGMALGVAPFTPTIANTTLSEGDLLLLYTDGIIEAHNPANELYNLDRLTHFLEKLPSQSSAQVVKDLLGDVRTFCEGALQHDDITLVTIQRLVN